MGLRRWQLEPGGQTTPAHVEEEIAFIVGGSGWSQNDGETSEVSAGDCLVHLVDDLRHTLVAGDSGLDVLAFSERGGRVPLGPPAARPARIVALDDVRPDDREHGPTRVTFRDLGRAAGSARTGIVHITIAPGRESMPPHVHSAEEELFVVLDGSGDCLLGDESFSVRRGSVVARPAGSGIAHSFVAGSEGLTMLAYGQRVPHDVCWYPRSQKLGFRAFGLRFRVADAVGYWDGEPE